jgi:hypothetical protein
MTNKLSFTIPEAADVTSIGETTLKAAIDRGDLLKRYPSGRPVVLATDLQSYLESLPTEKP